MSTPRCGRLAAALFLLTGLGGCETPLSPAAPSYGGITVVDLTEYTPATGSTVVVRFANYSNRPVYLPMGSHILIERFADAAWQPGLPWFVLDGPSTFIRIAPGRGFRETWQAQFTPSGAGRYRFRVLAYRDKELQQPMPDAMLLSQEFTIIP